MDSYIIKEFKSSFFTIFFVIATIISLIFIVSISNITSKIEITFLELIKMYLLTLPQIVFISFSIAFFIAANSTYSKLSETQEIIAMLSLGFKPFTILKPIIKFSIFATLINLIILFFSIPYSKVAFDNFKNRKKQEAKFNFQSNQISQSFGDWSIFATKKDNRFKNIYLFNQNTNQFIMAKEASLKSDGALHFNLKNGKIYDLNRSYLIEFEKMQINKNLPKVKISILNFHNYLKENRKLFAKYIPFALLPIALIFFIPLISFFHPRLNKNHYLLYSVLLLFLYLGVSFANKNLLLAPVIPLIFFIVGGVLFARKF